MSQSKKVISTDSEDWQVETLRLTAFHSKSILLDNQTWWEDLVGSKPESKTIRQKGNRLQENGPYEKGNLILTIDPFRVDWYFTIPPEEDEEAQGITTLGSFSDNIKTFQNLMEKFLLKDDVTNIARLASGSVLFNITKNRQEGYKKIAKFLPKVEIDAENSSDFFYQINRPRSSKIFEGLKLNRLSKWSIMKRKHIAFQITTSGEAFTKGDEIGSSNYACRLELDVNTFPELNNLLPDKDLPRIFHELVELETEITQKGDIS